MFTTSKQSSACTVELTGADGPDPLLRYTLRKPPAIPSATPVSEGYAVTGSCLLQLQKKTWRIGFS